MTAGRAGGAAAARRRRRRGAPAAPRPGLLVALAVAALLAMPGTARGGHADEFALLCGVDPPEVAALASDAVMSSAGVLEAVSVASNARLVDASRSSQDKWHVVPSRNDDGSDVTVTVTLVFQDRVPPDVADMVFKTWKFAADGMEIVASTAVRDESGAGDDVSLAAGPLAATPLGPLMWSLERTDGTVLHTSEGFALAHPGAVRVHAGAIQCGFTGNDKPNVMSYAPWPSYVQRGPASTVEQHPFRLWCRNLLGGHGAELDRQLRVGPDVLTLNGDGTQRTLSQAALQGHRDVPVTREMFGTPNVTLLPLHDEAPAGGDLDGKAGYFLAPPAYQITMFAAPPATVLLASLKNLSTTVPLEGGKVVSFAWPDANDEAVDYPGSATAFPEASDPPGAVLFDPLSFEIDSTSRVSDPPVAVSHGPTLYAGEVETRVRTEWRATLLGGNGGWQNCHYQTQHNISFSRLDSATGANGVGLRLLASANFTVGGHAVLGDGTLQGGQLVLDKLNRVHQVPWTAQVAARCTRPVKEPAGASLRLEFAGVDGLEGAVTSAAMPINCDAAPVVTPGAVEVPFATPAGNFSGIVKAGGQYGGPVSFTGHLWGAVVCTGAYIDSTRTPLFAAGAAAGHLVVFAGTTKRLSSLYRVRCETTLELSTEGVPAAVAQTTDEAHVKPMVPPPRFADSAVELDLTLAFTEATAGEDGEVVAVRVSYTSGDLQSAQAPYIPGTVTVRAVDPLALTVTVKSRIGGWQAGSGAGTLVVRVLKESVAALLGNVDSLHLAVNFSDDSLVGEGGAQAVPLVLVEDATGSYEGTTSFEFVGTSGALGDKQLVISANYSAPGMAPGSVGVLPPAVVSVVGAVGMPDESVRLFRGENEVELSVWPLPAAGTAWAVALAPRGTEGTDVLVNNGVAISQQHYVPEADGGRFRLSLSAARPKGKLLERDVLAAFSVIDKDTNLPAHRMASFNVTLRLMPDTQPVGVLAGSLRRSTQSSTPPYPLALHTGGDQTLHVSVCANATEAELDNRLEMLLLPAAAGLKLAYAQRLADVERLYPSRMLSQATLIGATGNNCTGRGLSPDGAADVSGAEFRVYLPAPDGAGANLVPAFFVGNGLVAVGPDQVSYLAPVVERHTLQLSSDERPPADGQVFGTSDPAGDTVVFLARHASDQPEVTASNGAHGDPLPCRAVQSTLLTDGGADDRYRVSCNLEPGRQEQRLVFTVSAGGQSGTGADTYSYLLTPVVTSVTGCGQCAGDNGTAVGGEAVCCRTSGGETIGVHGHFFPPDAVVTVDSVRCEAVQGAAQTASLLTCRVPAGTGRRRPVAVSGTYQNLPVNSAAVQLVSYATPRIYWLESDACEYEETGAGAGAPAVLGDEQRAQLLDGISRADDDAVSGVSAPYRRLVNCPRGGNFTLRIGGSNFVGSRGGGAARVLVGGRPCDADDASSSESAVRCNVSRGSGSDHTVLVVQANGGLSSFRWASRLSYEPCRAGTYAPGLASTECNDCEPGWYQPSTGALQCLKCEPGRFSAGAAHGCEDCAAGRVAPLVNSTRCEACNIFAIGRHRGSRACDYCPAGTYWPGAFSSAGAGNQSGGADAVDDADADADADANAGADAAAGLLCTPCPDNTDCLVSGPVVAREHFWVGEQAHASRAAAFPCLPGRCKAGCDCLAGAAGSGGGGADEVARTGRCIAAAARLGRGSVSCCDETRADAAGNPMCGRCRDGFSEWGGRCIKCDGVAWAALLGVVATGWAGVLGVHIVSQSFRNAGAKVYFFFAQAALLMLSRDTGWLRWASAVNLDFFDSVGGSCVAPLSAHAKSLLSLLSPLSLFAMLGVTAAAHRAFRARWPASNGSARPLRDIAVSYWRTAISLGVYTYNTVTVNTLSYFRCVRAGDGLYVAANPALRCDDGAYERLLPLYYTIAVVLVLLGPAAVLGGLLWWKPHRRAAGSEGRLTRLGILYQSYAARFYWWEAVSLYRRTLLVTVSVAAAGSHATMLTIMAVLVFLFLLVQVALQPFSLRHDNVYEAASLCVLLLMAVSMIEASLPFPLGYQILYTAVMALSGVVFCLYFVFTRKRTFRVWLRRCVRGLRGRGRPRGDSFASGTSLDSFGGLTDDSYDQLHRGGGGGGARSPSLSSSRASGLGEPLLHGEGAEYDDALTHRSFVDGHRRHSDAGTEMLDPPSMLSDPPLSVPPSSLPLS